MNHGNLYMSVKVFLFACMALLNVFAYELEFDLDSLSPQEVLPSAVEKIAGKAFELNELGLKALEQREYEQALDYFEQALELVPNYSDALNNRGVVYFRKGLVGRAEEVWRQVITGEENYTIGYYNLGILGYHEYDLPRAIEWFEKALDRDKSFTDASVMLGQVYLMQGNAKKGLKHLGRAYKKNPKHQGAWSMYAYGLLQKGDTATAEKVLLSQKRNAEALGMLGAIYAERGQFEKAIGCLKSSFARGGPVTVLVDAARVQLNAGSCKDALSSLGSYFDRTGQASADAYVLAGVAAKECNRYEEAMRYFQAGVESFPRDPILRFNLGHMYYYERNYQQAEAMWSTLADTMQEPSLYALRAHAARHMNDNAAAENHIRQAIRMDGKAEYHDLLGVILHERGKKKEAVVQFKKALKINPDFRSAQLNLAVMDQDSAHLDVIITEARSVVDTCKSNCAEARLKLSILYYHRRNLAKALETLERVAPQKRTESVARHLAIYYREQQQWDKAIDVIEKVRRERVLEPQTEYELAENYLHAGKYQPAFEILKSLVEKWPDNPWRLYYQMGYAAMELNDMNSAQKYFTLSLKKKSDNVAARGLLAFVHNRKGNTAEARQLWARNLKDDPDNPVLWINMGLLQQKRGNYADALEKFKKALILDPDNKAIHLNIGNMFLALNRTTDALHEYSLALQTEKRRGAAYNSFIASQRAANRKKAREMLDILEDEFGSSLAAKRAKGEWSLWQGDTLTALKTFEQISDKNENDWYALGRIYATQGNAGQARRAILNLPESPAWNRVRKEIEARISFSEKNYDQAYQRWKELADTSFYLQYNLALSAYHAGRYQEALRIAQAEAKRTKGKDFADVCRLAGNAAFELEKWEDARGWYRQLSAVRARDPIVQYNLAVASYNLDDIEKAHEYYETARKLDSSLENQDIEQRYKALHDTVTTTKEVFDSVDLWYNNAIEMQNDGNDSLAQRLYQKILKSDSTYVRAWNNLGAIYGARGELERAEEAYLKAIERKYDLVEAYANLVNIYIAMEEFKKARILIFKGKAHNPESQLLEEIELQLKDAEKKATTEFTTDQ
ncbi:MAG: tetratricopeptide repeat protein [Fibrobacterota bacterium]